MPGTYGVVDMVVECTRCAVRNAVAAVVVIKKALLERDEMNGDRVTIFGMLSMDDGITMNGGESKSRNRRRYEYIRFKY